MVEHLEIAIKIISFWSITFWDSELEKLTNIMFLLQLTVINFLFCQIWRLGLLWCCKNQRWGSSWSNSFQLLRMFQILTKLTLRKLKFIWFGILIVNSFNQDSLLRVSYYLFFWFQFTFYLWQINIKHHCF